MTNFTYAEYLEEVEDIASQAQEMANTGDCDLWEAVHELVDGHQWVIYYSNNLSVLEHCRNEEAMIDQCGPEAAVNSLEAGGLNGLHSALAYFAMVEDVNEYL